MPVQILVDNPLLLLFAVAAIGYPLGRVKVKGSSLGVAAVLFVGLAAGALHPDLKLPEIIYQLGLVLFVYTIGLGSGRGFFASFRRKGLRDNALVAGLLCLAAGLTGLLHMLLGLKPTTSAGLFAGSLTNTPALAAVLEQVKSTAPAGLLDPMLSEPVVSYSVAYPVGVVGVILAIVVMQRVWQIDYAVERQRVRELGVASAPLANRTVRVTQPRAVGQSIKDMVRAQRWGVIFGRIRHAEQVSLASVRTCFELGDLVSVIGRDEELERVTSWLGQGVPDNLEFDRSEFDHRRIFVSRLDVAGRCLRDLHLPDRFGAIVTRIKRGDMEWLPDGDTRLELGDRVRVLAHRANIEAVSVFFGDSYRALSEIDILTFGLGLALGLLVGSVPIPLPGGLVLKLGLAGGPLLVALVLGALGRTGPMLWSLPYSANLTLRQIGLIFFLAGVGTRSGYAFVSTLTQGNGLLIFAAGALITCGTALATLWLGRQLFKIPFGLLLGMLAGLHTQPAVLGFALEQADDDLPNVGYATVYPVATIAKIVLAQALYSLLA